MKFPLIVAVLAIASNAFAIDPPDVYALKSPTDYQVFQRETRTQGAIVFSGNCFAGCYLMFKVTGIPLEGQLPADWIKVELKGEVKKDNTLDFSTPVSLPAGGWYKLEMKKMLGDKVLGEMVLDHVGIGEVFVIAGQSNSTNYGSEKQKTISEKVSSFDGKKWVLANDPQPGTQDGSKNGSFAPAFGDAIVEKYKVPVGIASTGAGATSVRQWLPKGERMTNPPTIESHVKKVEEGVWESTGGLFEGLMKRVHALGKSGFRAILWHQGESDAGQARGGFPAFKQITGAQYADFMEKLIKASRQNAGWEIPWFNAWVTYHSEKDAEDAEFRTAQKSLSEKGVTLEGPDTDKLGKDYRAGVHFNGKGLQTHGKLWAEKVGVYLDKVLAK